MNGEESKQSLREQTANFMGGGRMISACHAPQVRHGFGHPRDVKH